MGSRSTRRWRRARVWCIPVLVTLALTIPGLVNPRWAVDMGWYAGISRGILERGDPWFLHAGDREFFNKPPLGFWIHAASLWAFGGHAWSVRLPGVLGVCACVLATVAIVRRLNGPRAAMFAGIIAGSTPELIRVSTQYRLDVPHTLFILLAVLGVVVASKREGWNGSRARLAFPMLASGVMIGLALMTKPFFGPLAYLFMAPWLIWQRRWRTMAWIAPAVLLGVAIAAPWHIAMMAHYGRPFTAEYLGRQVIGRGLGTTIAPDPWWYYLRLMFETYWPWAATLACALVVFLRRGPGDRHRSGAVLAISWVLLWIVAVSIFADKRRQYILPAYPAMAWISAIWLASLPRLHRMSLLRTVRLEWLAGAGFAASLVWMTASAVSTSKHPPGGWPRTIEYLQRERVRDLWAGSIDYNHAGMVCALTGVWPRTIDWSADYRTPPPPDALVLYSEKPPPPGAEQVFASDEVSLVRWPAGLSDPRDHDRPPAGPQPWFVR